MFLFYLFVLFFEIPYIRENIQYLFLFTCFTMCNTLLVHLCGCKWKNFYFYDWAVFHCAHTHTYMFSSVQFSHSVVSDSLWETWRTTVGGCNSAQAWPRRATSRLRPGEEAGRTPCPRCGSQEELPHVQGQGWRPRVPGCNNTGAAKRTYTMSKELWLHRRRRA